MSNVIAHIEHYTGPWNRAVDIGAHVGLFSVEAAKRGAQVWAFEPSMVNFQALLLNAKGCYPHIFPFQAAVVPDGNGLYSMSGPSGPCIHVEPGNGTYPVIPIGFAALLRALTPIDFLKVDIEGHEHKIFNPPHIIGPLLERVRFLQLEIHPQIGAASNPRPYERIIEDATAWLQELGFTDEPCGNRQQHAGDFCSHNHNFKE